MININKLLILVINLLIPINYCFETLISKSFADPFSTQIKDYWDITDQTDNLILINDYLKCDIDKYFGPFFTNYKIWKEYENIKPYYQIRGEFQLLLMDKTEDQVYADLIEISYKDN